jgi:hypothetical protein
MPGIGLLIEGAMQQAPQALRQEKGTSFMAARVPVITAMRQRARAATMRA